MLSSCTCHYAIPNLCDFFLLRNTKADATFPYNKMTRETGLVELQKLWKKLHNIIKVANMFHALQFKSFEASSPQP